MLNIILFLTQMYLDNEENFLYLLIKYIIY